MTETTEKKTTTRKATAPKYQTLPEALAAFQADLPAVTLDGKNPHFNSKFATLANINTIVLPKLSEFGLTFTVGSRVEESGKTVVIGKLLHTSGEYETAEFPVTETAPQKVGQAFTYARRYTLAALTGIVADGDDDAQEISKPEPRNLSNARQQAQKKVPAKSDDEFEGLRTKIREWIGSDEERRKAAVAANEKLKLEHSGVDLQKAILKELGV